MPSTRPSARFQPETPEKRPPARSVVASIRQPCTILGENNVPPDRLETKLSEVAQRFKALRNKLGQLNPAMTPRSSR
jgi:hypothetical protein